ncbi:hypothetical protein [Nonomuraea diastatica]|uniref:Uncharacterized protein n=1 Tax=Nonomuraea diastatica TaxID=1848329 RepID=A0A4R4VMN2_9ACTN|nr:hypothetical protein [Nonomuraea diastatica]TDD03455.1 hypothetical protein E1294_50695 [Nonomuraea diastatica]
MTSGSMLCRRRLSGCAPRRLFRAFAIAQVDWARSEAFLDPTDSFADVTVYRFLPVADPTVGTAAVAAFIDRPLLPVPPLHAGRSDDRVGLRALIGNCPTVDDRAVPRLMNS